MCDGSCFREEGKQRKGVRGQKADGQLLLFKDLVITYVLVTCCHSSLSYMYVVVLRITQVHVPAEEGTRVLGAGVTDSTSCWMWVLGTKPEFSARAVQVLNC